MTSTPPPDVSTESAPKKKKASSVRHTRAIQRDRSKRPTVAAPDEQVAERLTEIVHPTTLAQLDYYRQLGLRERILTLPVTRTWRWGRCGGPGAEPDLAAGRRGVRVGPVARSEKMLWLPPLRVTQQAVSERLSTFPAELFLRLLTAVLPLMQQRWLTRQRPAPPEIAWAQARYPHVWVVDGSTLDALVRKVGLLHEALVNPLAGRMMALLELGSRLPHQIWYTPDADRHDTHLWWCSIL